MKSVRDIRVLPVVLVAIFGLALLKVAGLLIDGGYVFDYRPDGLKSSWAQENINFPGRNIGDSADVTGSVLIAESVTRLRSLDPAGLPLVSGEPRLGPCVGSVGKFIGIGLNYADHAAETGAAIPKEPVVFNKWVTCISGCNDDIQIPAGSIKTDWEVELGVVIGQTARRVSETEALNHVAGRVRARSRNCQTPRSRTTSRML